MKGERRGMKNSAALANWYKIIEIVPYREKPEVSMLFSSPISFSKSATGIGL